MRETLEQVYALQSLGEVEYAIVLERARQAGAEAALLLQKVRDNDDEVRKTVVHLKQRLKMIEETGEDGTDAGGPAKTAQPTRRAKREQRKFDDWIARVEDASGVSYDEMTSLELTPSQLNEALTQATIEARPTTRPLKTRGATKYEVDPITGEKTRIHDPRRGGLSKS